MEKYLNYAKHIEANEYVLKWIETTLKNYCEKNQPATEEIEHIIDYLAQAPKISRMSYKEAKSNAEKWLKTQIKKGMDIEEKPEDIETILDFGDGFRVVKLIGENAFKREGFLMSSCVASYFGKNTEIFSLRDKDNLPHATLEKNQQIKGRGNGDICLKYIDYIVKFLQKIGMTVSDDEMKHLGYINVSEIMKKEPDLIFPDLYNGKYFYKEKLDKVENKDRILLWDLFGLVKIDSNFQVKFNFDIGLSIKTFLKSISSKITAVANKHSSTAVANEAYSTAVANKHSSTAVANKHSSIAVANEAHSIAVANEASSIAVANEASSTAVANEASSIAVANNKNSIALLSNSKNSKVKAKIGSCIIIVERDDNDNIISVFSTIVDGKKIKEDIWYTLKNKKLIKINENRKSVGDAE